MVLGLTGCAGTPASIGGPAPPGNAAIGVHGPLSAARRLPASADSYLYSMDCCGVLNSGDVNAYDSGLTKVVRRIVVGAGNGSAIALDRSGTLYVLNPFYSIDEFDRGAERPSRHIRGLHWGAAIALDSSNNLYLANCNTCQISSKARRQTNGSDSVTIYAPKHTKALRTIAQGVNVPQSLALDSAGNLYVANAGVNPNRPSVTVYAPNSTKLLRKITQGLTAPARMAIDATGDLFVENGYSQILEYAPGSTKLLRTITDAIASPQGIVVDPSGTLYVANDEQFQSRGWVSVYLSGSSTPEYRIVDGVDNPTSLAIDGDDDLYVANSNWNLPPHINGHISLYSPNSRTPLRTIFGGRYGYPADLALPPQ
jgi:sugar lactone lactonase YvrE